MTKSCELVWHKAPFATIILAREPSFTDLPATPTPVMQSEFVNALFAWMAAHPGWMSFVIFITAAAESLTIVSILGRGVG